MKTHRVWVIGGDSGIGAATAQRIEGYLQEWPENYPGAEVLRTGREVDVLRPDLMYDFWLANTEPNNGFSAVVFSAGVNELAWFGGEPQELVGNADVRNNLLAVNCGGFLNLVDVAMTARRERNDSGLLDLVAVSSDAATRPLRTSAAYCASKAALNAAVKCAARELAPHVRVNAVAPGMTAGTEMTRYIDDAVPHLRGWSEEKTREYERSQIPAGRRATSLEIGQAITSLIYRSPLYQTGSIVEINGGR